MKLSVSFAIVFVSVLIAQSFASPKQELPKDATLTRTEHMTEYPVNGLVRSVINYKWFAKYQPVKGGPIYEGEVEKGFFNSHKFHVTLNKVKYSVAEDRLKVEN
ncbi:hypothetical protein Ddc_12461 [Ditylenchus destructor]|nr:hypothetical protein Ddc_12461 [Ditylenchus destructor]